MRLMKIDFKSMKKENDTNEHTIKLQKYLSMSGLGSRRKCELIISRGIVTVNNRTIVRPGIRVSLNDTVKVNNKVVKLERKKIYLAVYKPTGYLCSNYDAFGRNLVKDLFSEQYGRYNLYHAGRLDYNTSGLIFYTNDGNFANIVMHPSFGVKKMYIVKTVQKIDKNVIEHYRKEGLSIKGIKYILDDYKIISSRNISLTLNEGKNREIRKVFNHFGIKIEKLERVRIGNTGLEGLKYGEYRRLTGSEVDWFLKKYQE